MPGAYVITICTDNRRCLFGEVVGGAVRTNAIGELATNCWRELPSHFSDIELDAFVVMPNHLHGIVKLTTTPRIRGTDVSSAATPGGTLHVRTLPARGPRPRSIGAIVGSYKAAVTRRARHGALSLGSNDRVWQRNYYEHIIRDEADLTRVRQYIIENPIRWTLDRENPDRYPSS